MMEEWLMKRMILVTALVLCGVGHVQAQAAFTWPSFTLSGPPSTGTVCTPTAASSGLASAAPAGAVMFNCIVSPVGWQRSVQLAVGSDLNVANIVMPSTATTPTFQLVLPAAGVAQTYAGGNGNTLP
jgi:hypothetical protein